jgi:hypothetical protein
LGKPGGCGEPDGVLFIKTARRNATHHFSGYDENFS